MFIHLIFQTKIIIGHFFPLRMVKFDPVLDFISSFSHISQLMLNFIQVVFFIFRSVQQNLFFPCQIFEVFLQIISVLTSLLYEIHIFVSFIFHLFIQLVQFLQFLIQIHIDFVFILYCQFFYLNVFLHFSVVL